jgi:tetratricopeptide (TPR) repeat protein
VAQEKTMRSIRILFAVISVLTLVTTSYAGPTTNSEEYQGDKKLTKAQEAEYQKHLDQGTEAFEKGEYDKAESEYKAILSFAPKKNLAYFNLGLTKYKQGDYPAAISYFDTVIKKRSYYVGAAFYYKAISLLNLDKKNEALKTAKRYTQAKFFYKPSQSLIKTIQTGSDEYMENAKAALADENYELCLLELEESVLSDTKAGKDITGKCQAGMTTEERPTEVAGQRSPNRYRVWLDSEISHTDNAYQENFNQFSRYLYDVELGGEYVWANTVDYGIGASYKYSNANDLPDFKDELWSAWIPFFYRNNNNRISGQLFYNLDKYEGAEAWSQAGAVGNYFYTTDSYSVGVVAAASTRTALDSVFDYKKGPFTSGRLIASKFVNSWTLSAYVGADKNDAGSQPLGTGLLPFGNEAVRYGASVAVDFNEMVSRLTLRGNGARKDYIEVVSPNGTDRVDNTSTLSLTYLHKFNKNVRAWLEQSYTKNDSTYDSNEVINKNYTENLTTLGLSLMAF